MAQIIEAGVQVADSLFADLLDVRIFASVRMEYRESDENYNPIFKFCCKLKML